MDFMNICVPKVGQLDMLGTTLKSPAAYSQSSKEGLAALKKTEHFYWATKGGQIWELLLCFGLTNDFDFLLIYIYIYIYIYTYN